MTCHLGDFEEYAGLRRAISDREAALSRDAARPAGARRPRRRWRRCGPATSSGCPAGRRGGLAVVLDPGTAGGADGPRPTVLTAERQVRRLSLADFPAPVEALHRLRIPKTFNPRNPAQPARPGLDAAQHRARPSRRPARPGARRSAAADDDELLRPAGRAAGAPVPRLRRARGPRPLGRALPPAAPRDRRPARRVARAHPHDRPDLRPGLRAARRARLPRRRRGDTDGRALGALYTELDLLAAECLRDGRLGRARRRPSWPPCVSVLVYESRRADDAAPPQLPTGRGPRGRWPRPSAAGRALEDAGARRTGSTSGPRAGPAASPGRPTAGLAASRWTRCCATPTCAPGDFVRWTKQVVDLLGQLADAAGSDRGAEPRGRDRAQGGRPAAPRRGRLLLGRL